MRISPQSCHTRVSKLASTSEPADILPEPLPVQVQSSLTPPSITRQEPIPPFITPPWQRGPKIYIEKNDETAREKHDSEIATGQDLSIYTDGSGIDDKISAAAVCPFTKQTRSAYLGLSTTSTVYAAELYGICLALQIARDYVDRNGSRRNVVIYTDNQAAIWSVTKAEGRTGSYILEEIARQIQDLQD